MRGIRQLFSRLRRLWPNEMSRYRVKGTPVIYDGVSYEAGAEIGCSDEDAVNVIGLDLVEKVEDAAGNPSGEGQGQDASTAIPPSGDPTPPLA